MVRAFDILFSVVGIMLISPFLIIIIIILCFTGEGEIFFSQERIGKKGEVFKLHKFATMVKNSPFLLTGSVTTKNDPRILPFGKFLRKTKINEIPQLYNILVGDMSFIGPRPQEIRCFNAFPKNIRNVIIKVKPGLSGLGPIIFRNEEEMIDKNIKSLDFYDNVIAPYKGKVEAYYVSNKNVYLYFILILLTIWVVIFPNSNLIWKVLPDLPKPPKVLAKKLNFLANF